MISVLSAIWESAGYPWSVRLKALLPVWMPWARTRFHLTPRLEEQLLRLSPRTIDYRLRPRKRQLKKRIYGRTKPGTLLKHHIPLKTDCWDVHASLEGGASGFVLLDVRSPEHFRRGHVKGAVNLPHARISPRALAGFPEDELLVVYCAGPHCNGADKAALKLASLGRRVKKMIGDEQR